MATSCHVTTTMRTSKAKLWFQILSGFLFLALASVVHAAHTYSTPVPFPPIGALSPGETRKLINEHKSLIIIDVRTKEEFERGHIPGARSIPIRELADNIQSVPTGPVLLVCRTGRRAQRAYELIHEVRPAQQLWYLQGSPTYFPDGSYTFQ